MEKIIIFEKFLNEALGIAEPTLFYLKDITDETINNFYKYIDDTRSLGKDSSDTNSIDIIFNYRRIKRMIPNGQDSLYLYYDFPISEIILTLDFEKSNDYEHDLLVGGYASPFAKGREKYATRFKDPVKMNADHSLSIHMGISVTYGPNFRKVSTKFPLFDRTKIYKKVESVISHELNHLYESYNRRINGSKGIETALTWSLIGDENFYDVSDEVFKIWQSDFGDFVYLSEPHEVNAQTQESKSYIDKTTYQKFKSSRLWKTAKNMQSWSYLDLLKKLKSKGIDDSTIDSIIFKFIGKYEEMIVSFKEDPSISTKKLYNMDQIGFFKFFQEKINKSGNKLIRNYGRIFSAKNNL